MWAISKPILLSAINWPANDVCQFMKNKNGTVRPLHAPSMSEGVPQSSIPTSQPRKRTAKKCKFDVRTRLEDQFSSFKDVDYVDYVTLVSSIGQ